MLSVSVPEVKVASDEQSPSLASHERCSKSRIIALPCYFEPPTVAIEETRVILLLPTHYTGSA